MHNGTQSPPLSHGPVHHRAAPALRPAAVAIGLATMALAAAARTLSVDPYGGVDWSRVVQHRANLHTHTTESDGRLSVSETVDLYWKLNYDILAVTDHNRATWPWSKFQRDPARPGMLPIPGNELSRHHHTLSLFSEYASGGKDLEASLRGLAARDGLAILAHPAAHWPDAYARPGPDVQVPLAPALRAVTRGDFTVSAWFRTTGSGRHVLVGTYGKRPGALNLELHTDNRVRLYLQSPASVVTDLIVPATALGLDTRDGGWHRLVGVREGKTVRLYLDGRPVGEAPDRAGPFELAGEFLYLGRDTRTEGIRFLGDLACVRLWARAVAPQETTPGAAPAAGLLAEYRFGVSEGVSLAAGVPLIGRVDETAGHPQGPFHGQSLAGGAPPQTVADLPQPLREKASQGLALRFGAGGVPAAAVAYYRGLFERHPALVGMEVVNGTRPIEEHPLDRELWDALLGELMPARPVWGMANDDMHGVEHFGRDWSVFPLASLDAAAARGALERGAYYFSTTRLAPGAPTREPPPRIERIDHDASVGRIAVRATVNGRALADRAYTWISHGRVVHVGPVLDYRTPAALPTEARYVRLEIAGAGGTTFTNPFGFQGN